MKDARTPAERAAEVLRAMGCNGHVDNVIPSIACGYWGGVEVEVWTARRVGQVWLPVVERWTDAYRVKSVTVRPGRRWPERLAAAVVRAARMAR